MRSPNPSYLVYVLVCLAVVILSSSVHEFCHGFAAHLMGDDTAKEQGRLTLNPLAHIDLVGSVLLPLACFFLGGFFVAYAKPVPYNPNRLRNRRVGEAVVAAAGPLSNLAQAVAASLIVRIVGLPAFVSMGDAGIILYQVLYIYISVNAVLCFFNLIPLPPLDGSKIVAMFLSDSARRSYFSLERYSTIILICAIWLVPRFFGINLLTAYFNATVAPLVSFLLM